MCVRADALDIGGREHTPAVSVSSNFSHLSFKQPTFKSDRGHSDCFRSLFKPEIFSSRFHSEPVSSRI